MKNFIYNKRQYIQEMNIKYSHRPSFLLQIEQFEELTKQKEHVK